jgi:glycosyltransferase involved in cell wall biosynthesis
LSAVPAASCLTGPHRDQGDLRHLLHVFASFGYGGVPIRICEVINGLAGGFRHTIVALDGRFDAGRRLGPDAMVTFRPLTLPKYNLLRGLARLRAAFDDAAPDLLLTYNWGAIEAALANRLFGCCDHIHFESGFGVEEGEGQLWRRNLFRRFALARTRKVVVPSATLMDIAASAWSVPPARLLQIPNGVDLRRFRGEAGLRDPLPGLDAGPETVVVGTVAPLRPEKNVGRLLRAFARLPQNPRCLLVVAGDGVELAALRRLAASLGIAERTAFLGHVDDVPAVLRGLDIFALSSDTEQMPNSLLQAMAAARPVAAIDVGDVGRIVARENRPLVVPRGDERALTAALATLAGDAPRRRALGRLNQERVRAKYSLGTMVAAYGALLGAA